MVADSSFVKIAGVLLFALFLGACEQEESTSYALLIKNGKIIDGSGMDPYFGQLLIAGDSIALIDRDTTAVYQAEKVIDADGYVVTPGFIDTHAHGNPLETPDFENFISMGVTSICLGQDGFSPEERSMANWMDKVDQANPAVNIAQWVGHSTLRLLSGTDYDTLPTEENLSTMEALLSRAMADGCFGMSTGLEYTPGYFADSVELNRLARVVGDNGGLLMSHIRNEDDAFVMASIKELLAQSGYCPVHIAHIKVVYGQGQQRAEEILQLLDSARRGGKKVTADYYPYAASYTGIGIVFPEWAKPPNEYQQVLREERERLSRFLKEKIAQRNGPEALLIGSGEHKGKTLAQVATELNKPFDVVLMDDIGPEGTDAAHFVMDESLQERFLEDSHIMICSDGSPTMRHPRGHGAFAKIIETYVQEKKTLPLSEAIYKMTGLPAETIGLYQRGNIKEGYKADILIFKPSEIKENTTYENPHQPASGFQYIIVNGKVYKEKDQWHQKNGLVLRKRR